MAVQWSFLKRIRCSKRGVLVVCVAIFLFLAVFSNVFHVLFYEVTGKGDLPLTLKCNTGRLGNQICTFATLLGLSALNGRRAQHCNLDRLAAHFPHLGRPKEQIPWFYWRTAVHRVGPFLKAADGCIPADVNYVGGFKHPCSYTFFDHVREDLRRRLQFQPETRRRADAVLRKTTSDRSAIFVGVHVRRGDYQQHWLDAFEGVAADLRYFRLAMEHFRRRFGAQAVFVAVSDDREWCERHLVPLGVHVSEAATEDGLEGAVQDLAVLAACNHTIMTYGTFGFWGAWLAGGETIYFDRFLKPDTFFARERFLFQKMYPPQWKGIAPDNSTLPWLKSTAVT